MQVQPRFSHVLFMLRYICRLPPPVVSILLVAQDMLVAGDGSLSASEEDLAAFDRSLRSMEDCHIKVRCRAYLGTRCWLYWYMISVTGVCTVRTAVKKSV